MEKEAKKTTRKIDLGNIFILITILLGIILVINIFLTYNLNQEIKKSIQESQEKLKPAKIELAAIKDSKCSDCFDISTVISHIKNAKPNITKESIFEFNSKEGKELIGKYRIEKIPTVIVTGEIDKFSIQGLDKRQDALLLANPLPPYTNAATGKIEGRVTLYHLKDSKCDKCNDLTPLIDQIKGGGVRIYQEKIVEPGSDEGKELAKKYSIDFVPSLVLSQDAGVYELIQQSWNQIGSKENDGSYITRLVFPPFLNLTTGKVRGLVNIVYLNDSSCSECYDVKRHKEVLTDLEGYAIKLEREETFDISDAKGKELAAKYNITKVPIVILSDEVSVYPSSSALKQFFSIEKDGSFVFRLAEAVGTYRDLTTSQVVKAQTEEQ